MFMCNHNYSPPGFRLVHLRIVSVSQIRIVTQNIVNNAAKSGNQFIHAAPTTAIDVASIIYLTCSPLGLLMTRDLK